MAALLAICFLQAVIISCLQSSDARTIEYFIGTVDVMWDYAPSGINLMAGVKLDEDKYVCGFLTFNIDCCFSPKDYMFCTGSTVLNCTYEEKLTFAPQTALQHSMSRYYFIFLSK